jgi:predicted DsbA family dithiol-disulfide isomerase
VRAEIAQAQQLGVTGVPFFIFAQRFAVPGAQGADVLTAAIDRARKSLAGIEAA